MSTVDFDNLKLVSRELELAMLDLTKARMVVKEGAGAGVGQVGG